MISFRRDGIASGQLLSHPALLSVKVNRMEVEIGAVATGHREGLGGIEPGGGPSGRRRRARVLGEGGALGDCVGPSEEGDALADDIWHESESATDAPGLDGEPGESGVCGGDAATTQEDAATDGCGKVEAGDRRYEEE